MNLSVQASDDYFKQNNEDGKFVHPLETQDLCYNESQIFDSQHNIPTPITSVKKKEGYFVNDTVIDKGEASGQESCTQDLIGQLKTGKEENQNLDLLNEDDNLQNEIPLSQQDCVISMLQEDGLHATRTVTAEYNR